MSAARDPDASPGADAVLETDGAPGVGAVLEPAGERLAGGMGNGGRVLRRGGVVLRPTGPHSVAVTALLQALAATRFTAPVPLWKSSDDVQAFSWIGGEVALPPFPAWSMSEEALVSVVRLLRDYHEAVAGLALPRGLRWSSEGVRDPRGGPVICHNDVCPENVVFRSCRAFALLDFDFAAPGRPVWDLANLARMWCPLRPPGLEVEGMAGLDPLDRLRVIARAYGLRVDEHAEFVEAILESARLASEFLRRRLLAGEPAFLEAWGPLGAGAAVERVLAWVCGQRDAMLAALR
jgi:hypothetical protein